MRRLLITAGLLLALIPALAEAQQVVSPPSLAILGNVAANSILGNNTGSPAPPAPLNATQVVTFIGPNITNSSLSGLLGLSHGALNLDLTGSGGTSQFLKQNTVGGQPLFVRPVCGDLSNAAASCSTDTTSATNITSGTLPVARLSLSQITNFIVSNTTLNNTGLYFDGPTIAQGGTGTWFVSGSVSLVDVSALGAFNAKLWDGTTIIASGRCTTSGAGGYCIIPLSGYITSPAGNIRISVKDDAATTGFIAANASGNGKDSTVSAFRIQ